MKNWLNIVEKIIVDDMVFVIDHGILGPSENKYSLLKSCLRTDMVAVNGILKYFASRTGKQGGYHSCCRVTAETIHRPSNRQRLA